MQYGEIYKHRKRQLPGSTLIKPLDSLESLFFQKYFVSNHEATRRLLFRPISAKLTPKLAIKPHVATIQHARIPIPIRSTNLRPWGPARCTCTIIFYRFCPPEVSLTMHALSCPGPALDSDCTFHPPNIYLKK